MLKKNEYIYTKAIEEFLIVSKTDVNGKITYVNDLFCQAFEFDKEEVIGKTHSIIKYPTHTKEHYETLWDTIKNKKEVWKKITKNSSKSGKTLYQETIIIPMLDENEEIIEFICLRTDITNYTNPNLQLKDYLKENNKNVLVYICIENYFSLEEIYNEVELDKINDEIFQKIIKNMPTDFKENKVFNLGNGEFAIVRKKILGEDLDYLQYSISEFQKTFDKNEILEDYQISILVSLSYGDKVLENAKLGMKKIKNSGNNFIVANNLIDESKQKVQKNMEILNMVNIAINNNKIVSYFQPIINNETKEIEKYESLVRLIDENNNVLSPYFFLEVSKKGKYYHRITKIVLNNSIEFIKKNDVVVSVNLSALDIETKNISEYIIGTLKENIEVCNKLIFEILEDEKIDDFNKVINFVNTVKKLGVKIAIDDFGTGYSNFERLLDYQPDIVKIDGTLIKNIVQNKLSLNIVETIVSFAKKQNMEIVGEFVENEEIYTKIKELGVDYSQGYYFGKPSTDISKKKNT